MIDHRQVQSLILNPYSPAAMELVFVRFPRSADLKALIVEVTKHVTFADQADAATPSLHIGLTATGLQRLGIKERAEAALPMAFRRGMRRAAPRLGDFGGGDPEHWSEPFGPHDAPIDAVLILSSGSWKGGDPAVPDLAPDLAAKVLPGVVGRWSGTHRSGYEPFGFRDGISDPVIEGSGRETGPGRGIWDAALGRWRPMRAGEALRGHVDERGQVAGHPAAAAIERDGSYLVIRKLAQDVEGFERGCDEIAANSRDPWLTRDRVAEQLVGRTKEGDPLGVDGGPSQNDFLYRRGPGAAVRIPPSSHIRRANPRDDLEEADLMVKRHQLLRRGIPYGDPEGGNEQGLIFLAACSDLERQFEFVQAQWMQDGNRFGLSVEPDGLTGTRPKRAMHCPVHGVAPSGDSDYPGDLPAGSSTYEQVSAMRQDGSRTTCVGVRTFVTMRGGEYVLVPGRAALVHLAKLPDPGRSI